MPEHHSTITLVDVEEKLGQIVNQLLPLVNENIPQDKLETIISHIIFINSPKLSALENKCLNYLSKEKNEDVKMDHFFNYYDKLGHKEEICTDYFTTIFLDTMNTLKKIISMISVPAFVEQSRGLETAVRSPVVLRTILGLFAEDPNGKEDPLTIFAVVFYGIKYGI